MGRPTGVIVPMKAELAVLRNAFANGRLDNADLGALVQRVARRLNRACWCAEGVCCEVHDKHVTPHTNCILR
jgi:hypothetical protein